MTETAILVEGLTKRFGNREAAERFLRALAAARAGW